LSACSDAELASDSDLDEIRERDGDVPPIDVPASVCTNKRIVGRAPWPLLNCPAPANPSKWTVTNVLEDGTDYLATHHVDLPGVAGRFCAYQWNAGGAPTSTQVNGVLAQLAGSSIDCMMVQPLSTPPVVPLPKPMNETIGPVLQTLFHDRAGMVEPEELLGADGLSTEDDRVPVRVSIVDVDPTTKTDYFNYDHGEMLKRMLMDLACPATAAQDCAVDAVRVLALPMLDKDTADVVHGGRGGGAWQVAAGLMEAHRRWQVAGGDELHFINLSVGWQDEPFGDPAQNMIANTEAVHVALQHLACHGEIVLAAAGNGDPLTCSEQGVYPARWQTEAAPTAAQCVTLLGVADVAHLPVPIPATTRPLVYAVAGLSLDGQLLPTTPELSVGPLVAIADHGIGGAPENTAMVGTSVGTIVATAAAAMAGSYNPGGNGWDAMQAVYAGGAPAGLGVATMAMAGLQPQIHRVDVCGALLAACNGACDFQTPCTPNLWEHELTELDFDYGGADWSPAASYGPIDDCSQAESICGADTYAIAPGDNNSNACAWNYVDPGSIYVKPQPPKPPCPACTLTTEQQTLSFTLSSDFAAADVENVTIHITDGTTGAEFSVNLGDPPVTPLSTTDLIIDDRMFQPGMVVKRAVVDVKISGKIETNDVLVR
jgi:hypothetical protein